MARLVALIYFWDESQPGGREGSIRELEAWRGCEPAFLMSSHQVFDLLSVGWSGLITPDRQIG